MQVEHFLLFSLTLAAIFFAVATSIALIVRKAFYVKRRRAENRLYIQYSAQVAELLLADLPGQPGDVHPLSILQQYETVLLPLKRRIGRLPVGLRPFHREALRSVMVDLAQDVTGETRDRLTYFYSSWGFVQEEMVKLRRKKWWIRAQAARNLRLLGARKAIPLLTIALDDAHADVRYEAMQSLVHLRGVDALREILRKGKRLSRWRVIELSVIVMQFKESAVPYLLEALRLTDQSVVLFSIEMLAEIGFVAAVEPLRTLLEEYPDSMVQAKAAEALGRLGDERAEQALLRLVSSPQPHLRLKAIEAVGRVGSRQALVPLREQFEKADLTERIEITRTIAALGPEGAAVIQTLASDPNEEIRAIASQVAEERSLNFDARRDE